MTEGFVTCKSPFPSVRHPFLIYAVVFPSDDPCDLKAESSPTMDNEITAKERGVLEENNEKEEMDQERAQEEEGEEKKLMEEEGEGEEKRRKEQEPLTEEQELEELRAQVLQLLLELEDARETSNKHQESFHELQGETTETVFLYCSSIFQCFESLNFL